VTTRSTSSYSQGERLKASYNLSSRERRSWSTKVLAAQEAVDKAEEALDKVLSEAWEAGVSYASLGGLLGVHSGTAQKRIEDYRKNQ
jgi:hypothetical protein